LSVFGRAGPKMRVKKCDPWQVRDSESPEKVPTSVIRPSRPKRRAKQRRLKMKCNSAVGLLLLVSASCAVAHMPTYVGSANWEDPGACMPPPFCLTQFREARLVLLQLLCLLPARHSSPSWRVVGVNRKPLASLTHGLDNFGTSEPGRHYCQLLGSQYEAGAERGHVLQGDSDRKTWCARVRSRALLAQPSLFVLAR